MAGFLQMAAGLAVVLGAIAGAAWLAQRIRGGTRAASGMLSLVAALPVGPKESVVVVEFRGQWLVLGVAPGRVTSIAALPHKNES